MTLQVAGHLGLLLVRDLPRHRVAVLVCCVVSFAGMLWAWSSARPLRPAQILIIAGMLRLLLLPLPPTLSDDIHRYVWDGTVAAAGYDPYRLPPDAAPLSSLRDRFRERHGYRVPHEEVPTIYPPLALAVFSIASRTPSPIFFLKLALAAADVGLCALLLRLARRWRLAPSRTVAYAWNPLVVLEVAGMGHVEPLGVLSAAAAVGLLALRPRRALAAATATAAGVCAKLVPVVAIPLWARHSRRPWLFVGVVAVVGIAAFVPVLTAGGGIPPAWTVYARNWEFNGPLYEPLWRLLDGLQVTPAIKGVLTDLRQATGWSGWSALQPYVYPELVARLPLLALLLWQVLRQLRRRPLLAATLATFGWLVLCSPTVYPWYLLWVLPWAALAGARAWVVLSATILASYLAQPLGVPYWPWVYLLVWAPFFVTLLLTNRWRRSTA